MGKSTYFFEISVFGQLFLRFILHLVVSDKGEIIKFIKNA